jgi:hypothetical protein
MLCIPSWTHRFEDIREIEDPHFLYRPVPRRCQELINKKTLQAPVLRHRYLRKAQDPSAWSDSAKYHDSAPLRCLPIMLHRHPRNGLSLSRNSKIVLSCLPCPPHNPRALNNDIPIRCARLPRAVQVGSLFLAGMLHMLQTRRGHQSKYRLSQQTWASTANLQETR